MSSPTTYAACITTKSAFESRYRNQNLPTDLHDRAASTWGVPELAACRVVCPQIRERHPKLPGLGGHWEFPSPYPAAIRAFIKGPDRNIDFWEDDTFLFRQYGVLGQVWFSLGRVLEQDQPVASRGQARGRKQVQNPDYVPSASMQVGSSPPMGDRETTPSDISRQGGEFVVGRSAPKANAFLEDETLRLVSCAIRYVLYYVPEHESLKAVQYRDAKMALSWECTRPGGMVSFSATDDGGLRLVQREPGSKATGLSEYAAIVEAKRDLAEVDDGHAGISDRALGQMTLEALGARSLTGQDSVFVIHAARHYICFLEFVITEACLLNFDTNEQQEYIEVYRTTWLDLQRRDGREMFMRYIHAIAQSRIVAQSS